VIGRIPILDVQPVLECGQRPAKAVAGETFEVSATVFRDGHEKFGAGVVLRTPGGQRQPLVRMVEIWPGLDRYGADVTVGCEGRWRFHVEAWGDPIAHWRHDAGIKVPRGLDVGLMMAEGAILFERAARSIRPAQPAGPATPGSPAVPPGRTTRPGPRWADAARAAQAARSALLALATRLRDPAIPPWDRLAATEDEEIMAILDAYPLRELVTRSPAYPLVVHRQRALYGAWYEFFPRSEGAQTDPMGRRAPTGGTLHKAARRLEQIAAMGFDVVYLPPIHPIGTTARKGRNNALVAGPGDPGSPWAIGSAEGGHDAVNPELGTLADFDAFVSQARQVGLEVALDFALQASPDHPWVTQHPDWFITRADGEIAYAENPPKKYHDIYPLTFEKDPEGLYVEALRLLRHWIDHGVRIFRVDNPHTKPLPFWERLLAEVAGTDPDVIFLAEAFTRPPMMHTLAKIGFHQSYTYFTWRNNAAELTEYLRELSGPAAAYMRPNFFTNTPDILHEYLQHGGPAAFRVRAVLAAMLSPTWGVYSGYELCENTPLRPGSEEYMDSEKYQYRPRDWAKAQQPPDGIAPFIAQLNAIRKSHPATHWLRNLRFHHVDQPDMMCFSKRSQRDEDTVLVVVSFDPHAPREATVWLDMPTLGMDYVSQFVVTDELSGDSYLWGRANYVRLDPAVTPAHIFTVTPQVPA
jgi:starch synthase (maltosyl-transferring)